MQTGAVIFVLISIASLLGGIWLVILVLRRRAKMQASKSWPTTTATILSSSIPSSRTATDAGTVVRFYADVRYSYRVADREYEGARLGWAGITSDNRATVEHAIKEFHTGARVPVHYDPDDPASAVLRPDVAGVLSRWLWLGIVFIAMGACLLALGWYGRLF